MNRVGTDIILKREECINDRIYRHTFINIIWNFILLYDTVKLFSDENILLVNVHLLHEQRYVMLCIGNFT